MESSKRSVYAVATLRKDGTGEESRTGLWDRRVT